jgi:hypothetical protein
MRKSGDSTLAGADFGVFGALTATGLGFRACCAGVLSEALYSALRAGVFSFVWPKESSQRKGHPWVGAGQARFPALLTLSGGCGTRACGPQTVLALLPAKPALLGASQGALKNMVLG